LPQRGRLVRVPALVEMHFKHITQAQRLQASHVFFDRCSTLASTPPVSTSPDSLHLIAVIARMVTPR
jgi:hypothetical protein